MFDDCIRCLYCRRRIFGIPVLCWLGLVILFCIPSAGKMALERGTKMEGDNGLERTDEVVAGLRSEGFAVIRNPDCAPKYITYDGWGSDYSTFARFLCDRGIRVLEIHSATISRNMSRLRILFREAQ